MEYVMIGTGMAVAIACILILEAVEYRRIKNETRKVIWVFFTRDYSDCYFVWNIKNRETKQEKISVKRVVFIAW